MRSDSVGVVKRFQRATTHRAALTSQQRPRRDGQRFDLRDRTAAANQLLLCAIVAVLFVVGLVGGFIHRPELFALGALLIGLGGIAALAVPWTSIPAGWVAVLPLVDIVAIALMRQADPIGGSGCSGCSRRCGSPRSGVPGSSRAASSSRRCTGR